MAYTPPAAGQRVTASLLTALAGPWQAYTPTLTGTTLGNGSLITRYQQSTNRVIVGWTLNWGSTTSGNMPAFTLPVPVAGLGGMRWTGNCTINPGTGSFRSGWAILSDSATTITTYAVTSTAAITSSLSTAGITMVAGGWFEGSIEYEI